jgi:hypothetical protein
MSSLDDKLYPPRLLYADIEIEHLRKLFDLVEDVGQIDALLDDIGVARWFYDKGIVGPNAQKRAIRAMLNRRQLELGATVGLRAQINATPSEELARSRLAKASNAI